jgi:hypothetical protein
MKNLIILAISCMSLSISAQCLQPACENLPATITANVSAPPVGQSFTYNWTIAVPFTGQGTSQIVITNVGAAGVTIPYTIQVTNSVTGCVSFYNCTVDVGASAPVAINIPPSCANDAPFDLTPFISPPNSTLSGPGVTGTFYDPSIGGQVLATPPTGSGCIVQNAVTPQVNPVPQIISTTVTQ